MTSPADALSRARRPIVLLTALAVALSLLLAAPASSGAAGTPRLAQRLPEPEPGSIRVVQANLQSPQPADDFQQDARRILNQRPDLITYNEVAFRKNRFLAPNGYALHRNLSGPDGVQGNKDDRYGRDTPVAWRTDTWKKLDTGTWMLTNKWGKEPGRAVHLGVRYANWVTLENRHDGRVVSLVSVHFPPPSRSTRSLRENQVAPKRLRKLINQKLRFRGPVIVGGDLNLHFNGKRWPTGIFNQAGLTGTWYLTDEVRPTHGGGHTIDHILIRRARQFELTGHRRMQLNSDHHAVVADLRPDYRAPNAVTFPRGKVVNEPNSSKRGERRRVMRLLVRAINHTQHGEAIHIGTGAFSLPAVARALHNANRRGVHVQFISRREGEWNRLEKGMRRRLGNDVQQREFGVRCRPVCREVEANSVMPGTRLLISRAGGTTALSIVVNRRLIPRVNQRKTTATVFNDLSGYNRRFDRFLSLVGRSL